MNINYPYAVVILILILIFILISMIFGKGRDHSLEKTLAYRNVGGEIAFVFAPFTIYLVTHYINGSALKFLTTAELPMAAMILFGMGVLSLLKGKKVFELKDKIGKFRTMLGVCILFLILLGCLVIWLTLQEEVSSWFSIINLIIVIISVIFSFAVNGAIAYLVQELNEKNVKNRIEKEKIENTPGKKNKKY